MVRVPFGYNRRPQNQAELEEAERLFLVDIKEWLSSIDSQEIKDNLEIVLKAIANEVEATGTEDFLVPWERIRLDKSETQKILLNLWREGLIDLAGEIYSPRLPTDRDIPVGGIRSVLDRRSAHYPNLLSQSLHEVGGWNGLYIDLSPIRVNRLKVIIDLIPKQKNILPTFQNGIFRFNGNELQPSKDPEIFLARILWNNRRVEFAGNPSNSFRAGSAKSNKVLTNEIKATGEVIADAVYNLNRQFVAKSMPINISRKSGVLMTIKIDNS